MMPLLLLIEPGMLLNLKSILLCFVSCQCTGCLEEEWTLNAKPFNVSGAPSSEAKQAAGQTFSC